MESFNVLAIFLIFVTNLLYNFFKVLHTPVAANKDLDILLTDLFIFNTASPKQI